MEPSRALDNALTSNPRADHSFPALVLEYWSKLSVSSAWRKDAKRGCRRGTLGSESPMWLFTTGSDSASSAKSFRNVHGQLYGIVMEKKGRLGRLLHGGAYQSSSSLAQAGRFRPPSQSLVR